MYDPSVRADPSVGAEPVAVDVTLVPPTHTIRLDALAEPVLWHRRFGHIGGKALQRTAQHVSGLRRHRTPKFCDCCVRAKLAKSPTPKYAAVRAHADKPLGQVSIDTIEYSLRSTETTTALTGCKYAAVFVDGYSRYRYVHPMRSKAAAESLQALKKFIQHVGKPEHILTDYGTEYKGVFEQFCTDERIRMRKSCPYRAYMNGLVERSNRVLKTIARTLLIDSNLPPTFWCHALLHAASIANCTAWRDGPTPHELLRGNPPDVSHFRVFGAPCYSYIEKDLRKPLEHGQHAEPCIFLGFAPDSPSYLLYRPKSRDVLTRDRSDVVFDEGFTNAADVLLDRYTRPAGELLDRTPFMPSTPRPRRRVEQADVDEFFKPSVQVPAAHGKSANDRYSRVLLDNTGKKLTAKGKPAKVAQYIADRCKALDGLTYKAAQFKRFVDGRSRLRYYTRNDLNYDLAHRHLIFADEHTALSAEQQQYLQHATRHAIDVHHAHALVQTGDEPISFAEMLARNDSDKWVAANKVEWDALKRYECFDWVDPSTDNDVPDNAKLLSSKWVWKRKPDRYKSRVCIRGFLQDLRDVGETYAPVCRMESIRALLALSVTQGWSIRQADITNAYIRAPLLGAPVFMQPPDGIADIDPDFKPGHILRLKKSLYGLKASGRNWYIVLRKYLVSQGLQPSDADPCLYMSRDKQLFIGTWVDDLCIVGKQSHIDNIMHNLRLRFGNDGVKDLGRPNDFLGIQLSYTPTSVKVSQPRMIERLLRRFNRTPAVRSSPMPEDMRLTAFDHSDTKPDHTDYRSLIGGLNYIATSTRADVAYSVHQLARHMANPSHAHMAQAFRVLDYLAHTKHDGPTYTAPTNTATCVAYSDADWAGSPDDRRSTSGRVVMLNNAAFMWASCAQKAIALSTAEAEWYALCDAGKDCLWARKLLRDLGISTADPTRLMEDNTSAIKWSTDSAAWSRTRHIDTRQHAIRSWVESGDLHIEYCPTDDMLADIFTKPLNAIKHAAMAKKVFGAPSVFCPRAGASA